jgi:hypothetical protein
MIAAAERSNPFACGLGFYAAREAIRLLAAERRGYGYANNIRGALLAEPSHTKEEQ